MQKLLLALVLSFFAIDCSAQIQKGNWLIGGSANLGITSINKKSNRQTFANIYPEAGYFFLPKLAGGVRVNFDYWKANFQSVTLTSLSPFVRYYLLPVDNKLNLFVEGSYLWFKSQSSLDGANEYAVTAGPAFFISSQVALQVALQYKSLGGGMFDKRWASLGFNTGLQLHLGKAGKKVAGALGQIEKGQWLLGGSFSLNVNGIGESKADRNSVISARPGVGYFFLPRLAGGVRATYLRTTAPNAMYDPNNTLWISPFVRYYFLPSGKKINIFGDAAYGWGRSKQPPANYTYNRYTIGAGPAIFLSRSVALEFTLQYSSDGGDGYDSRLGNVDFQAGFQVMLP